MKRRLPLGLLAGLLLASGCSPVDGENQARCGSKPPTWSVPAGATPFATRADCSVDITAQQAWPNRALEQPALTADEHARACAAVAACTPLDPASDTDGARRDLLALCARFDLGFLWEERAVPTDGKNERWAVEARAAIAAHGDCAAINAASTPRPAGLTCEEGGCYSSWKQLKVTCAADVATIEADGVISTRDCAGAFAACDPASPTGCTDRLPTPCMHPARDRCDGDVRLGCDGAGRVSFHDCARVPGGHCQEGPGGGACAYPDAGACDGKAPPTCEGDTLAICQGGQEIAVDCEALGFSGCTSGSCFP
jgi:hypothetical protein